MIIEAVRLVVTLAVTAAGFALGQSLPTWTGSATVPESASVLGALLGAGVGYVVGGLAGRLVRKAVDRAPQVAEHASGAQLFAGAFGLMAGLLAGAVAAVPLIVLLPEIIGWSAGALIVIVAAAVGSRLFAARSEDLLAAAGLGSRKRTIEVTAEPARTFVIDTSAAIDGRVLDLARTGLLHGEVRVSGLVLDELQGIADSGQVNHRRRGRRGLDVLDALMTVTGVTVRADERTFPEYPEVDAKLIALADELGATLITTDHNLARAAGLRGIEVLNLQLLGDQLRATLLTGDVVQLLIERPGSEPGQGVGYLEDGTMVVIEGGASVVGQTVDIEIASAVRTSVGRLLFGKLAA